MMIKEIAEKQITDLSEEKKDLFRYRTHVYEAQPTEGCPSGTRGRIGIFEMFEVDSDIENVIVSNPVEEDIYTIARKKGMLTMKEDAILKSFDGQVSFDEISFL